MICLSYQSEKNGYFHKEIKWALDRQDEEDDIQTIEFLLPCEWILLDVNEWKRKDDIEWGWNSRLVDDYLFVVRLDRRRYMGGIVKKKHLRKPVYNGRVVCDEFPLILLTSNAERELPAPFLRRCLRLDIAEPNLDKLKKIVESHFGKEEHLQNSELIETFFELRQKGSLSTDQLLNAIYMTTKGVDISSKNKDMNHLRDAIFKYLSTMGSI